MWVIVFVSMVHPSPLLHMYCTVGLAALLPVKQKFCKKSQNANSRQKRPKTGRKYLSLPPPPLRKSPKPPPPLPLKMNFKIPTICNFSDISMVFPKPKLKLRLRRSERRGPPLAAPKEKSLPGGPMGQPRPVPLVVAASGGQDTTK